MLSFIGHLANNQSTIGKILAISKTCCWIFLPPLLRDFHFSISFTETMRISRDYINEGKTLTRLKHSFCQNFCRSFLLSPQLEAPMSGKTTLNSIRRRSKSQNTTFTSQTMDINEFIDFLFLQISVRVIHLCRRSFCMTT